MRPGPLKIPVSVLVVLHTPALEVLLLNRADHPGFWQSVTGSLDTAEEPPRLACAREVAEETGLHADPARFTDQHLLNRYPILPGWRHRYAAEVIENCEHVFTLCVPVPFEPRLSPGEHTAFQWLDWRAAATLCSSPTNAQAIRRLGSPPSPPA